MTGREKIEAAFSPEGSPEFAAVIPYEGIFVRDHWDEFTACPWWYAQESSLERQMAWRRDMLEKSGVDWFSVPACLSREERERISIEERPAGVFRADRATGREWKLERPKTGGMAISGGVVSVHPETVPQSVEEVDLAIPEAGEFDADEFVRSGRADLARMLVDEFGGSRFPVSMIGTPLWSCYGSWGFEGLMTLTVDRPDLVSHACGRIVRHAEYGIGIARALGASGVWIEDCMTDMISPGAFRDLHMPHVRRLTGVIRAAGMDSVYYFCGNPAGKWDMIMDTGADAVSLEEGKKGFEIDIGEVVEHAGGRVAVLGNLDAYGVLERGSDEEVRAEVERQTRAGRKNRGRFIMSLGSPVTPGTGIRRVRRFVELARELGREPENRRRQTCR